MNIDEAVNTLCRMGASANLTSAVMCKKSLCLNAFIRDAKVRVILKNGKASSIMVIDYHRTLAEKLASVIGQPRCEIRTHS